MNKLKFLLVALISLSVVFTSCKNDEPKEKWDVEAQVSNGAAYNATVDSVYAYVDVYDAEDEIVGRAKYENGGFKMNLSAVPSSVLDTPFDEDDIPEGVTVSDKSAKISSFCTFVGLKGDKHIGEFYLTKYTFEDIQKFLSGESKTRPDQNAIVFYAYADKDVSIKGVETYTFPHYDEEGNEITYTEKTTYNVNLKQGWNLITGKTLVDNDTNYEIEVFSITKTDGYNWVFISEDMYRNVRAPRANVFKR